MNDFESLAERYLLGELDEIELEATELRLDDETFFRRVQLAEDELIDAYLADELDAARRQRFETYFLRAPERQRRLQVSRLLVADSQQHQAGSPRRRLWIPLVAAVLLATAASWTLLVRQELSEIHRRVAGNELVVDLDLGVQRSAQRPAYKLTAEARPLRLRITADPRDLETPVEIVLRDASGTECWRGAADHSAADKTQPEPLLELVLAQGLPAGAYELEVLARPPDSLPTPIGYAYFDLEAP